MVLAGDIIFFSNGKLFFVILMRNYFVVLVENVLFALWRESVFFQFLQIKDFCFFSEKFFLRCYSGKIHFCGYGGKWVLWFWREVLFRGFDGKMFMWFWREMRFCGFGAKYIFAILKRNFFFFGFSEKTRFCFLGDKKYIFWVLAGNFILRF